MGLVDNYCERENVLLAKERCMEELSKCIYQEKMKREIREYVFLCIGSDKMTGDCFGPLVGTKLQTLWKDYQIFNIHVVGNLANPVCYTNIDKVMKQIEQIEGNICIVVIDAALSKEENIGNIYITREKTVLGKGLNKHKIAVGDISLKAVVGKDYKMPAYNFRILQNISLQLVMQLADIVSESIFEVMKYT